MRVTLITASLLTGFLFGEWTSAAHGLSRQIVVSAAVSLKEAFNEIGRLYQGRTDTKVTFSFGASGELEKQIEAGAPVDVFASASSKEMDQLQARNLIDPAARADFARNSLVLVVPADSRLRWGSFIDLEQSSVHRIAIGNPKTVPAGAYAQQLLRNIHLWPKVESRLVLAENVRQVLDYVIRGEVEAGIVYATDARVAHGQARVAASPPDGDYGPILYPIAVIKDSPRAQAAKVFVDLVLSPDGTEILKRYGFLTVK